MRQLTFSGFLTRYVRSLSCKDTGSLYALVREAAGENPRLREPLLLYALYTDKAALLLRAAKGTRLSQPYGEFLRRNDVQTVTHQLEAHSPALPEEYHKVWRTYQSLRARPQTDMQTKALMYQKIRRLQEQNGITNYRIYTDLKLNQGNLNAWLKTGESGKVSLATARRVLRYVQTVSRE